MSRVLALLGSGRRNGYTATLMIHATEGMREIPDIEVEVVYLHDYALAPCRSCFECIRDPQNFCILEDEMGKRGEGELFQKVKNANAILLCDPVHLCGPSAQTHLFVERCYPFLWNGDLIGMPFASISCATNQGMQRIATRDLCKWAYGYGMLHIGALSVHASHFSRALSEARSLGRNLAEMARKDFQEGRRPFPDRERFRWFIETPWNLLDAYLDNLSDGTFQWEDSLIEQAIRNETFTNLESMELLHETAREFRIALEAYQVRDYERACDHLTACSTFWTHATWKEFLESDVIGISPPTVYRPLEEHSAATL